MSFSQKNIIACVVEEKVNEKIKEYDKFTINCIGYAAETLSLETNDIKKLIETVNMFLDKFKNSTLELDNMTEEQIEKIRVSSCDAIDRDLETAEAMAELNSLYPSVSLDALEKIYKKEREKFLKPTVEVDMDLELKQFDAAIERKKKYNEKRRKKDNKVSNLKIVSKELKLQSDLGEYTLNQDGVTTTVLTGEEITFQSKEAVKAYIDKWKKKIDVAEKEILEVFDK